VGLRNQSEDAISPTMPFVATDRPNAADSAEISPTMPFVPVDVPDAAISPTMPFEPKDMPATEELFGISATMPFQAKDVPAATADAPEISPTLPFVPSDTPAAPAATTSSKSSSATVPSGPAQRTEATARKGVKRSAAALKAHSSEEVEDVLPSATQGDDEGEPLDARTMKELKNQREWLQHKKRTEKQQAKEEKQVQKKLRTQQKAAEKAKELSTAMMSEKDRQRLEALVGGKATTSNGARLATPQQAGKALGAGGGGEAIAGFGVQRKRSAIFGSK